MVSYVQKSPASPSYTFDFLFKVINLYKASTRKKEKAWTSADWAHRGKPMVATISTIWTLLQRFGQNGTFQMREVRLLTYGTLLWRIYLADSKSRCIIKESSLEQNPCKYLLKSSHSLIFGWDCRANY